MHNDTVGGRLDELSSDGFRFDTGPSLLLAKDIYEETFKALGSNMYDHVELRRVEPAYKVFLDDNSNVSLTAGYCCAITVTRSPNTPASRMFVGMRSSSSIQPSFLAAHACAVLR